MSAAAAAARALLEGGRRDALLHTGALQRAIFNSATFSSIATDARGVIQIFNVGAERMLGYTAAEVVDRVTPADLSEPIELLARAAALTVELGTPIEVGFEALVYKASRGIEDIYELTYVRKDQRRLPAVVSVTALRDAAGLIIGYLLIATDNTARRAVEAERTRLEHALQDKNLELEEASRMKSEFLANMSHELRTPLNAIIGFSEVLRDGMSGPVNVQQRAFASSILGSGEHLLSLISDILDLSKIEAGKMTLALERVELSSLFASCQSIFAERAHLGGVELAVHVADVLGVASVDPRKVKQILYNLVSNAVKFTSAGGVVTVEALRVPRGAVGVEVGGGMGRMFPLPANDDTAEFLQIRIIDTGIGISAKGLTQLFAPFSQIDSGLGRRFAGTGLGLVLSKRLAELHGGTIAVASVVGTGSCFTVWLPVRAAATGLVRRRLPVIG